MFKAHLHSQQKMKAISDLDGLLGNPTSNAIMFTFAQCIYILTAFLCGVSETHYRRFTVSFIFTVLLSLSWNDNHRIFLQISLMTVISPTRDFSMNINWCMRGAWPEGANEGEVHSTKFANILVNRVCFEKKVLCSEYSLSSLVWNSFIRKCSCSYI